MHVHYILDSGQHIGNKYDIDEWMEWYERHS